MESPEATFSLPKQKGHPCGWPLLLLVDGERYSRSERFQLIRSPSVVLEDELLEELVDGVL